MAITSPADIANLHTWHDAQVASSITSVSDIVSEWRDLSGNAYHLNIIKGSPNTNTETINGNNAIGTDESSSIKSVTYSALSQPFTEFIYFKAASFGGPNYLVGHGGSHFIAVTVDGAVNVNMGGSLTSAAGIVSVDTPHLIMVEYNGVNSKIYLDGALVASGDVGSSTSTYDIISGIFTGLTNGNATYGEITRYSRLLTLTEISDFEDYTATHWADTAVLIIQTTPTGMSKIDMATTVVPTDSILSYYDGSHDGVANASVLTDTTASWTVDELVGLVVKNVSDGSTGTITANTATTITATLADGTDNDWDIGDSYIVQAAFAVGDQVAFEATANHSLGSTGTVVLDEFGVPTITGTSDAGTWTFDYWIKDANGVNSATYTATITVT